MSPGPFTSMWHPQSTLLLDEPRCFAKPGLIAMFLGPGKPLRMRYAGDRMWPSLTHGQGFDVETVDAEDLEPGDVVVVCPEGIPDLLRIVAISGDRLQLAADADPQYGTTLPVASLIGRARLPRERTREAQRRRRRRWLDFREAVHGRPDSASDPADTVRVKYDMQAPFYSRVEGNEIEPRLFERLRDALPAAGRVLVVGSGAGKESVALAREGYRVRGVDFSEAMVEQARAMARERGVNVEFDAADIRRYHVDPGSLDAVLFTYDVYSFIPHAYHRIEVLRSIRGWLAPGGAVFLSARRLASSYARWILTSQWLARRLRRNVTEWGDSHTRYVGIDGRMYRSFVHVFSDAGLNAEIADAGLRAAAWEGGHAVLSLL